MEVIVYMLASVGALLLFYGLERSIDFFTFHWGAPSNPLESYRNPGSQPTYALITGGNGGIGFGIALSLVRHGFGVILLGRNSMKLAAAAEQLRLALVLPKNDGTHEDPEAVSVPCKAFVKTIVLDPQTATPEEIEASLGQSIVEQGLQVTILVNNVGTTPIAHPPFRELATYSSEDIDRTLDLNARFMAHLTARMLPLLARNSTDFNIGPNKSRRSLILNLSSGATIGLPFQVLYASTKGFIASFSYGLSRELQANPKTSHIDVLAIKPGDVKSQCNVAGLTLGVSDSESYGRYIVEKTDRAIRRGWKEMTPYWLHHLGIIILPVMPEWLVARSIMSLMMYKGEAINDATKPKASPEG